MNILGANKVWQVIVMFLLIAGLAVFNYIWITDAAKVVKVPLGDSHTFAQMNFDRMYVDHYGEETPADRVEAEKERLREEYEAELAAYEEYIAGLEPDEEPERDKPEPPGVPEEMIRAEAAALGQGEVTATIELNLAESVVFCGAVDILVLYLFYLFVIRKGKSAEAEAPDHESRS